MVVIVAAVGVFPELMESRTSGETEGKARHAAELGKMDGSNNAIQTEKNQNGEKV